MKKILALLMVLAMSLSLVACGGNNGGGNAGGDEPTGSDQYDIVFLADLGTINDGGFNQGTWEGCSNYASDNGLTVNYLQPAEDSDDARRTILIQACEQWGAKVCVACGFLWETVLVEMCPQYPDVHFVFIDGSVDGIDNLASVCFKEQEVGFLAGYAAVKDGYTKLAFFGGMAVPSVIRFGYGFAWGADYAAQELGLTDVSMNYWYSGDFNESPEKTTHVSSWYETGTEVVFSCGGSINKSAAAAAEAGEGRYLIGVDIDESDLSERVITSAMKAITVGAYDGIAAGFGESTPIEYGKTVYLGSNNNGIQLPQHWERMNSFGQADYDAIFAKLAADEGGISSSIPTDADYSSPAEITFQVLKLNYEG